MNKKIVYLVFVVLIGVAVAAIVYAYNRKKEKEENKEFVFLERKGDAANTTEWKELSGKAKMYSDLMKDDPTDTKTALKLAALFIEEARITGNHRYYDQAAMRQINNVLKLEPSNFHALVFKSVILMSQHHFADGLNVAIEAQKINPSNAYVYGLLVDGNVEMGNYDSAVANADRMVAIRPDLTSYSRISYLREINGDYPGAIKAMDLAVSAGGAGDEHTEWTRTQLANLYEKTGDYNRADSLYRYTLKLRPAYAYAIAGLGRVALANNNYDSAIDHYKKAVSLVDDYGLNEELADIYRESGKVKDADEIINKIIVDLQKESEASESDEEIGHYGDQELAVAYLKKNDLDNALKHALVEYNRRPLNIDVNHTLAWMYYSRKEYAKALQHIKVALRTNSKNPILLSRASLIFYNTGDKELARSMLQQVSPNNMYVGKALMAETKSLFQPM